MFASVDVDKREYVKSRVEWAETFDVTSGVGIFLVR